ncbi:MAG TPA: DUF2332 domain-containing protein [Allosphingosinicella sp.]
MTEAAVRAAFRLQAEWCRRLGSPFTGLLCDVAAERLTAEEEVGRRILGWSGNPEPSGDALALRFCGGLHFLVRSGRAPELARFYPAAPMPDAEPLWRAVRATLRDHADGLLAWLERTPQTNEVGRSAVLMAGLLVAVAKFQRPLRLFELGASAGLNLNLDRYRYDLGGREAGDSGSPLQLSPEWKGVPPPAADIRLAGRTGVDLSPVDARADAQRLLAYVWPDQPQRLRQLELALRLAADDPPQVARGDAADWLEAQLDEAPQAGVIRTVFHSVAYQYFPPENQERIAAHVERVGAKASIEAPLAWLRFEKQPGDEKFSLRLRTWPDGEDALLAWSHPHGSSIRWLY